MAKPTIKTGGLNWGRYFANPNACEQQQKTFDLTPELESWLLAAADKPTTPLTKADFTAIRERVRAKISAAQLSSWKRNQPI